MARHYWQLKSFLSRKLGGGYPFGLELVGVDIVEVHEKQTFKSRADRRIAGPCKAPAEQRQTASCEDSSVESCEQDPRR
jgi:hypothetical protein